YTVAQWLIRGAMAEFAAAQLLPWGVLWCLRMIDGRSGFKLFREGVVLFVALYLAHAVIFLYFALPVAVAILLRLWRQRDRAAVVAWMGALSAVLFLVVTPILLTQHRLGEHLAFFQLISQFQPQDRLAGWRLNFSFAPERWRDFAGRHIFAPGVA